LTSERVSGETIRATLSRLLSVRWMRPLGGGSPPPTPCTNEKRRRDRLMEIAGANPEWATGFEDECWWSRVALPTLSARSEEGEPLRLLQRAVAKDDPEPKAISRYGLYLPEIGDTWLRFVDGRPVGHITTCFLSWCAEELEALGKKGLLGDVPAGVVPDEKEVARKAQPRGQGERRRSEDRQLPFAQTEPVAELHRAEVGARQEAQGRRAGRAFREFSSGMV
jgi:hypothetical protein